MRHAAILLSIIAVGIATLSAGVSAQGADEGPNAGAAVCRTNDEGTVPDVQLTPLLSEAKTVFVVIAPAPPTNARWMGELHHELQRWSRWDEVERRDAADVMLSIGELQGEGGLILNVAVRARENGSVLWVSSGRDVAEALKSLEIRLPSLRGACAGLPSTS